MERSGIMEALKERKVEQDLSFTPIKLGAAEEVATFSILKAGLTGVHGASKSMSHAQTEQTIVANAQTNVKNPQELSSRFLNALKELG